MAKNFQFEEFESGPKARAKAPQCMACEELLTDALDQNLGEVDQAWFDRHLNTCAECCEMYADAQRGSAWLELLKTSRPEPSASLVERILAQTSGQAGDQLAEPAGMRPVGQTVHLPQMIPAALPVLSPAAVPTNLLAFRPRMPKGATWSRSWTNAMLEPRLAMTAAMAFFSLALTMNLAGVRLNELHLSNLKPENLKHTYYEANAHAVRYYDNLRVVRVLESRVEDMRQADTDDSALSHRPERSSEASPERSVEPKQQAPEPKPEEKKEPKGPGVSERRTPQLGGPEARPRVQMVDEKIRRGSDAAAGLKTMRREGGLA